MNDELGVAVDCDHCGSAQTWVQMLQNFLQQRFSNVPDKLKFLSLEGLSSMAFQVGKTKSLFYTQVGSLANRLEE